MATRLPAGVASYPSIDHRIVPSRSRSRSTRPSRRMSTSSSRSDTNVGTRPWGSGTPVAVMVVSRSPPADRTPRRKVSPARAESSESRDARTLRHDTIRSPVVRRARPAGPPGRTLPTFRSASDHPNVPVEEGSFQRRVFASKSHASMVPPRRSTRRPPRMGWSRSRGSGTAGPASSSSTNGCFAQESRGDVGMTSHSSQSSRAWGVCWTGNNSTVIIARRAIGGRTSGAPEGWRSAASSGSGAPRI